MRLVKKLKLHACALMVLCSAATVSGPVSAQDVVIGHIAPFTVLPSRDAHELNAGAKAYFSQVNARGGINGRKVTMFELDDKFSGDSFVAQFSTAMLRKPVALLTPVGPEAMGRLVGDKLLDQHDVVVINGIPGAERFRKPGHPRHFHVRSSDRQQMEKILSNALTMGILRFQTIYQDSTVGTGNLEMLTSVAAALGNKQSVGGVPSKHDDAALAQAAKTILAQQPQGVVLSGSPKFMADALRAIRAAGGKQFIFATSYLPAGLAVKVAGVEATRGLGIAQTFPNPNGAGLPLQREFKLAMAAADPALKIYTPFHLEGYVTAAVLTEGLRRAGGKTDSASLARALRTLSDYDLGGYRVNFSQNNEGSRYVDIGVVAADGRLSY